MDQLHPGAKWSFRFQTYIVFMVLGAFLAIGSIATLSALISISVLLVVIVFSLLLIFIIFFGELFAHLSYKNWKYEFTDTNLKIEKGIIWKKYSNIPYERVQNVDVHRGILARMLGFSTLNIQTAGYSSYGRHPGMSEGHIPAVAVDKAEKIREFIMKKIGRKSGV